MRRSCLSALLLALAAAVACGAEVHYLTGDGSWATTETTARDGRIQVQITPQMAPGGQGLVVIGKPDWMVLDDTASPELTSLTVDGREVADIGDGIRLGALDGDTAQVVVGLQDDKNPVATDARLQLEQPGSVEIALDAGGLGPPETAGRLIINLSGLSVGHYEGTLRVRDLSPLTNSAAWPVSFTVMGISVSDDGQTVTLANTAGASRFEPGLSRQIRLPVGQQLYLTGSLAGWVYPRELTDVQIVEDAPDRKTVLISSADLENDKREPVADGTARIEYELTIRSDTPCLLVTSRLYNLRQARTGGSFFWGWLSGAYFVTPTEGRKGWEGQASDRYLDIGHIGWVWLAPRSEGQPGLVWMSDAKFVESRFNTMILRSTSADLQADEFVEMRFAIGPAESPEEAQAMYMEMIERGLLPQPPAAE